MESEVRFQAKGGTGFRRLHPWRLIWGERGERKLGFLFLGVGFRFLVGELEERENLVGWIAVKGGIDDVGPSVTT